MTANTEEANGEVYKVKIIKMLGRQFWLQELLQQLILLLCNLPPQVVVLFETMPAPHCEHPELLTGNCFPMHNIWNCLNTKVSELLQLQCIKQLLEKQSGSKLYFTVSIAANISFMSPIRRSVRCSPSFVNFCILLITYVFPKNNF